MEQSAESPATAGVTPQDDTVATPWGPLPGQPHDAAIVGAPDTKAPLERSQADGTAPVSAAEPTMESTNDAGAQDVEPGTPSPANESEAIAHKANAEAATGNLRPLEPGVVSPDHAEHAGAAQDAPAAAATQASEKAAEDGATGDAAKETRGANAGAFEAANAAKLFPDGSVESAVAAGHASTKAAEIPEDKGESHDDRTANKPRVEVTGPSSAAEKNLPGVEGVALHNVREAHVGVTEAAIQRDANTLTPGGIETKSGLPAGVEPPKPPEDPDSVATVEMEAPLNTRSEATTAEDVQAREGERDLETGVDYPMGTDPKTVNVVPAAMIDAPALVVPERGKPIPYMEAATRTLPVSALQKGRPVNEKGEEMSEDESTYTPQPQTPDPLVLTGARPASAYRRTLPVGAEPQPGGPRHPSAE